MITGAQLRAWDPSGNLVQPPMTKFTYGPLDYDFADSGTKAGGDYADGGPVTTQDGDSTYAFDNTLHADIDGNGVYTAPSVEGTYLVSATSSVDARWSASAIVVVSSQEGGGGGTGGSGGTGGGGNTGDGGNGGTIPPPTITAFTSDTSIVEIGQPVVLSWSTQDAYQVRVMWGSDSGIEGGSQFIDVTGLTHLAVYPIKQMMYFLRVSNPSGVFTSGGVVVDVTTMPVSLNITPKDSSTYVGLPIQFGFNLIAPTNRLKWSTTVACTPAPETEADFTPSRNWPPTVISKVVPWRPPAGYA